MSSELNIRRINDYNDSRFDQRVLNQHGAFLVNEKYCFEVDIIGLDSAIIRGQEKKYYPEVIEEFRFFAEHITQFFDAQNNKLMAFQPVKLFKIDLKTIKPSQFYVDKEKKQAVKTFIETEKDIVIPVIVSQHGYISLDGHTRLSIAVDLGFNDVYGFISEPFDYIFDFVREAELRNINSVFDIQELDHKEYQKEWHGFCNNYWSKE